MEDKNGRKDDNEDVNDLDKEEQCALVLLSS